MMHTPEVVSFRVPALKDGVSSCSRARSRAGREPQLPGDLGTSVWHSRLNLSPTNQWHASEPRACRAALWSPKPDAEVQ